MLSGSVARRYAKAVFEIGQDQGGLDKIAADLRALATAMKSSDELTSALTSPAIQRSDRRKVIDGLLQRIGVVSTTRSLLYLLLDHERIDALPMIVRELDKMIEAKAGRVSAEVVSARPLEPAQLSELVAVLEKLSGKKINVSKREDPELLGGVVAKVGDTVYDGSLRTELQKVRDALSK
ncbi:MAG TPA: ATP synthase F1 subunit delta [Kofleriaceae bacterium]|jgi:F-type H+-transporting ATPase subunit delta